jgi:hypothetical protein
LFQLSRIERRNNNPIWPQLRRDHFDCYQHLFGRTGFLRECNNQCTVGCPAEWESGLRFEAGNVIAIGCPIANQLLHDYATGLIR